MDWLVNIITPRQKVLDLHTMLGIVEFITMLKKGDINFVMEEEKKKFKELFNKFDLAFERWEEFNFKLEEAPFWADYDFDLLLILKGIIISNFFSV